MPSGGCVCGNIAYKYDGEYPTQLYNAALLRLRPNIWCLVEPAVTAVCHCLDCQKWTGSGASANVGVPTSEFKITKGTPKRYTRPADSGKNHTQFFCGSKWRITLEQKRVEETND
jgi:hypothetical protein